MPSLLGPGDVVLDRIISIEPNVAPRTGPRFYIEEIKSRDPRHLHDVHLAFADER